MSGSAVVAALAPGTIVRAPSQLGVAEGRCRPHEPGPAVLVSVRGLKDRRGSLVLEVYPPDDRDFLADDKALIARGKVFRRVYASPPAHGQVRLCIRVPVPGRYSLSLLHDRDSNAKFGYLNDGVGFAGNPRIGWSKLPAAAAMVDAGRGLTPVTVVMNYRHGLFDFAPIRRPTR